MRHEDKELRELLAELHTRLGHAATLDQDSRKLLKTVSEDIEKTLGGGTAPAAHAPRLEAAAARFEAEHPALAEAVRDIIDALGKAGI